METGQCEEQALFSDCRFRQSAEPSSAPLLPWHSSVARFKGIHPSRASVAFLRRALSGFETVHSIPEFRFASAGALRRRPRCGL